MSGVAWEYVGTDVRASFGDYKLNSGRIIRHSLSYGTRFAHFCAVFNNICSRPEAASDVISGEFVGPIVSEISWS